MNIKRIIFWSCFVIVLGLIVWGLIVAVNKDPLERNLGTPAPISSSDHVTGPDNAKVTLIEYGDFQCPACGLYSPIIERLMTEASTTLRIVFRSFPLPKHLNARLASYAAEAAGNQGKFWEMYRTLYVSQTSWSDVSDAEARKAFARYAVELGLNAAKFASDIDASSTVKKVDAQVDDANEVGIAATPTFFVNGKAIQNPQSYEQFKSIIDEAAK